MQEADATVACSNFQYENPKPYTLVFQGTLESAQVSILWEKIMDFNYGFTHYTLNKFKINEIIYGNEIESTGSTITIKKLQRSDKTLETGKEYFVTTYKNDDTYVVSGSCSGYSVSPNAKQVSESFKRYLDEQYNQQVMNDLEEYYLENAKNEICDDNLFSIMKIDHTFNCVKIDSIQKLVEREWGVISSKIKLSLDEPREENILFEEISARHELLENHRGDSVELELSSNKQHYKYPESVIISGEFSDYIGKWINYSDSLIPIDQDNKFQIEFEGHRFRGIVPDEQILELRDDYKNQVELKISYDW